MSFILNLQHLETTWKTLLSILDFYSNSCLTFVNLTLATYLPFDLIMSLSLIIRFATTLDNPPDQILSDDIQDGMNK